MYMYVRLEKIMELDLYQINVTIQFKVRAIPSRYTTIRLSRAR